MPLPISVMRSADGAAPLPPLRLAMPASITPYRVTLLCAQAAPASIAPASRRACFFMESPR